MSIEIIRSHFTEACKALDLFIAKEKNFKNIQTAGNFLLGAILSGNKIITCGNGGSMCDAMHFAEELNGRFRDTRRPIPAVAVSDPSYITCVANDFGYEQVFARYVESMGVKDDVLVAISTGGNSANVIAAAIAAKNKGMLVVGLTGQKGGKLSPLCDVEIRAPYSKYADRAQEIHIKVIHALIHYVETGL